MFSSPVDGCNQGIAPWSLHPGEDPLCIGSVAVCGPSILKLLSLSCLRSGLPRFTLGAFNAFNDEQRRDFILLRSE